MTGYDERVSDTAPDLGPPTDIEETDDELHVDDLHVGELHVDSGDEKTIETPDELGGTGGEQPGGAG